MPVVASQKPEAGVEPNAEEGCCRAARKKGDIEVSSCSWAKRVTGSSSLLGEAGPPTTRVTVRDAKGEERAPGSCGKGVDGGGPATRAATPLILEWTESDAGKQPVRLIGAVSVCWTFVGELYGCRPRIPDGCRLVNL